MLKSMYMGHSGYCVRICTIAALAFALLFAASAQASNPHGQVTIEPFGSSGSNVWGRNDNINYWAWCYPCDGTCDTHFTEDEGLTNKSSGTGYEFISGSISTADSYTLEAKCPSDGSHGAPDLDFKVVDVDYLKVDGAQKTNGATLYYAKAESGTITIEAVLTPTATEWELRPDFMKWNKGNDDTLDFTETDQLTVTVPKTTAGSITLNVRAGNGLPTPKWVTIVVVEFVQSDDLWFFNGCNAANYEEQITLTANGLSAGTFVWTVTAGTSAVSFDNDQDTRSLTNNNQVAVKSTGVSFTTNDVTISLTHNGNAAGTCTLTVYYVCTDSSSWVSDSPNATYGFVTWYKITLSDQFGAHLSEKVEVNEKITSFDEDYEDTTWYPGPPDGRMTGWETGDPFSLEDYQFPDGYAGPAISGDPDPVPVAPTHGDAGTEVWNANQRYRTGSTTSGEGEICRFHKLQFYRGKGRQE